MNVLMTITYFHTEQKNVSLNSYCGQLLCSVQFLILLSLAAIRHLNKSLELASDIISKWPFCDRKTRLSTRDLDLCEIKTLLVLRYLPLYH